MEISRMSLAIPCVLWFALAAVTTGDVLRAPYGGQVRLTANHGRAEDNPFYLRWSYVNKYDPWEKYPKSHTLVQQFGADNEYQWDANFTGRVTMDYDTGEANITNLGCWDDQIYRLELIVLGDKFSTKNASIHEVKLGLPISDNLEVTVSDTEGNTWHFSPADCSSNNNSTPPLVLTPSSDTTELTLASSVLSAPGVSFKLNGQEVESACKKGGTCEGEVMCTMSVAHVVQSAEPEDIIISVTYEDVEPWSFCIRPVIKQNPEAGPEAGQQGKQGSGASECCYRCTTYWSVWLPLLLLMVGSI